MAIQYVGGNTGTWAGDTYGNNTVSLTALTGGLASSASSGDFVVAAYATNSFDNGTLSITDETNAYTLVASETDDTNLRVAYKRLTGADASVTFGPTGSVEEAGAAAVHVWRGVDPTNPLDVAAVTAVASTTFSGQPNPAAITPTTTGAVIIAVGGAAAATGAVFTSSDLSNFRTATSEDDCDAMIGIGSKDWTSGSFDPAQFGGGTTGPGDSWAAVTMALRPEPMKYTMPSDSGSFQATGSAAGSLQGIRLLSAEAGSFTATGTSANLISTRIARADAGAYVLTVQDASTLCGRVVQPGSGAFYFTSLDVEFRNGRAVAADPGSFTSAGGDAALAIGKVFWVDTGEFSSTGGDAELRRDYQIAPETGEYLVNASDAELFTGVFSVVPDRTFNVKSDRRLFLSLAQDTTLEVPANSRDIVADPQPRDLHVPHEPRVFIVPKDSRKFAASSGERDFQ